MDSMLLLEQADRAFALGQANQGLALLRKYNLSNKSDAASWHRQANLEEQIGDISAAGEAHHKCIEIAPNNAIAYLYGGYWLQKNSDNIAAAAALYSIAFDLDPSILALGPQSGSSPQTQNRSREADRVMRHFFSEHHRSICSNIPNAHRIKNAQWVQTSNQKKSFSEKNFAPEIFFIPDLPTQPIFSSANFSWAKQLHSVSNKIKNELTNALQQQLTKECLRPYLGTNFSQHSKLSGLANSNNWMAIDLFKNGELNTEISDFFPETLKAISLIPTYNLNENPFEVFFSFLKPHQSIAPHFGQSNHALTVHLPLDIPSDCYLKVGNQKKSWREGEVLAFDDSFLHSAHNNSDQTRVVLIFSIWQPELTHYERKAVQTSFNARQKWLSERQSQLTNLLTKK